MLGAIAGDVIGSPYERRGIKTKDFPLFSAGARFTDDTVMTLAVAEALMEAGGRWENLGELAVKNMRLLGRRYPDCGYGSRFKAWLFSEDPRPYGSYGNGAAMRVSACGWAAESLEEACRLSRAVTKVSHNHPEALKAAEVVACCIFLARRGESRGEIRKFATARYDPLDFTLDGIRGDYSFDSSCQGSVPQAIEAFLEAESFEDAVRGAVSLGGDSDTQAAIAGSIAEACWGVPDWIGREALARLDAPLKRAYEETVCLTRRD
ncbi:MAG: ADP-ribosylglycohydrolase family protein [Pyramidobacter sp.]|jgi:ADP-ribosylglycohydrolase